MHTSVLVSQINSSGKSRIFWIALLIGLSLLYLVQIATPMRLNNDAIVYLSLATSAADGGGFNYHGAPERYPSGYPGLIFLLVKSGLGHASAFTALNCVFLGFGILASYGVLRLSFHTTPNESLAVCCLTLLSFVVIKHVTELASDTVYFGLAQSSLWAMLWWDRARETSQRLYRTTIAGILTVISIFVRIIGIALIPAFLLTAVGGASQIQKWGPKVRARRSLTAIVALALASVGAITTMVIVRTQEFRIATHSYESRGLVRSAVKAVEFQANEFGELFCNVPRSKLPGMLPAVVTGLGFLWIVFTALGVAATKNKTWVVENYVLVYFVVLCGTPWQDTRYLLPLTPLLLAYAYAVAKKHSHGDWGKAALAAYVMCFSLLGLGALVYSTRISLAGDRFPELYGDGRLRSTYRVAFGAASPSDGDRLNKDALELLYRYEPRARHPKQDLR
jgi:hypothetical protein